MRRQSVQTRQLADESLYRDSSVGGGAGSIIRAIVDISLATIKAQTGGVAFDVGAPLPVNARLLRAELNVIDPVNNILAPPPAMMGCTAMVQGGSDSPAGSILQLTDVQTTGMKTAPGANPYQTRGGQQLKMTLVPFMAPLSTATSGHLQLGIYYVILP